MPKTVISTDDTLEIFAARSLDSNVVTRILKGVEVELGEGGMFEGREWLAATLKDGASGFVLGPSLRGHSTFELERTTLAGIVLTNKPMEKSRPDPLAGVGGWLILVLVGLLLQPLMTIYLAPFFFGEIMADQWFLVSAIGGGALAGSSLFVAIALLNRRPSAPRLAQAFFVTSCAFWTGLYVASGIIFSSTGLNIISSLVSTVVWILYFRESRRVRITYGPMPKGRFGLGAAATLGVTTAIIVCLSTIGIANHRRQVWTDFQSEEGLYKVEAPGVPRKSTLPDGTTQVLFGNDIRGFVVLDGSIPNGVNTQTYLETLRKRTISNVNGSIVSASRFTDDGYSGLEFNATFQQKGAAGDLFGRVYSAGTRAFMLLVSGPEGGRTASDAGRFFRSFHIKTSE